MHSLILTTISIVLLATLTVASINYIPATAFVQEEANELVRGGFEDLETAWRAYQSDNRTYTWQCDTHTGSTGETFEDCERVIDNEGILPETGWESVLEPDYGFIPTPFQGGSWTYSNTGDTDVYFCLSGDYLEPERRGIERAGRYFPDQAFFMANGCGATTNYDFPADHSGSVYITYWLKRSP
jgi:hypothetical protein